MTETPEKLHFEIFVAMNEDGDTAFGHTAGEAKDLLLENFESLVIRIVALSAALTPPQVETGPHVDIPDTAGEIVEVEVVTEPTFGEVSALVSEALADDKREGNKFDADGFSNFFPEHDPETVRAAWRRYDQIVNGPAPATNVVTGEPSRPVKFEASGNDPFDPDPNTTRRTPWDAW